MADNGNLVMLKNRRALEALRNGVPNGDAVAALGCNQSNVESNFNALLSRVSDGSDMPETSLGMLVAGEFGSGKSHLLGYLEARALAQSFVCSRVVISKETPLFDLDKVYRAAVQNGRALGITGHIVEELAQMLRRDSQSYAEFFMWANREDSGLHQILPASLTIHQEADDEWRNEMVWFWSGEKIGVRRVRDGLSRVGQRQSYSFGNPKWQEMPKQRLRFMLELIKAAGYKGWVILMDEIELVGNYSWLQRARAYAELTRWLGQAPDEKYPGLIVVGTLTADFEEEVLIGKEDRDKSATRLRARGRDGDNLTADRAETGMKIIENIRHLLGAPDQEMLSKLYFLLKNIHSQAYDWEAPDIDREIGPGVRRAIRPFVRRWINEWDLRRLYPGIEPVIEETELQFSSEEDATLERSASDDSEPRGIREEGEPLYTNQEP